MGATQNNQSCPRAQPPTNRAGPVLRAGLTEVLVTGMPIRWTRVRPPVGGAEDDEQEEERHHHLAHERGSQRIAARGVRSEAVRGEAAGRAEARGAARDEKEDSRTHDGARHLGDYIRTQVACRKTLADQQSHRHRRVEMAAGYVADGVRHGQDRETEGQRHAVQADTDVRKSRGQDCAATSAQHEPGRAQELRRRSPRDGHSVPPRIDAIIGQCRAARTPSLFEPARGPSRALAEIPPCGDADLIRAAMTRDQR